jgi:prolyl-tRNA synthetase
MKLSQYILPTLKEDPADAVVASHRLMIRAGLIRKESAGMYAYLPLGYKALRKIIEIVRSEMDKSGGLEFLMPELTSAELWKESGRWDTMGPEMFRIKDRNAQEYALGPTHEEAFTNIVRSCVSSYKELPVNVYQINTKFRDEIRPRFGVIRSKEFIMKDAYSFDMDDEGLQKTYETMRQTYRNIFDRCGLETIPVQADSGNMGGSASEEFMVASEVGEEALLLCVNCDYKANQEKAEYKRIEEDNKNSLEDLEEVSTPGVKTIEQLEEFFKISTDNFLKTIIYLADEEPVMAVITGNREINEHKLKNILGCNELELAPDKVVEEITGAPVGFAGPANDFKVKTIFDIAIKNKKNAITGANKADLHFKGVNPGRDFNIEHEADIVNVIEGDLCPSCEKPLSVKRGIEVGHIFKLGYKYTKAMNLTVLDNNGKAATPIMGCYGIGVTRTLAAVVEQNYDEHGLIWPMSVAPYHVHLVGIAKKDEDKEVVESIYKLMIDCGIEVLFDDRKMSPGVKFANADLIGLPLRVTVGRSFFEKGEIELKVRKTGETTTVNQEDLVKTLKKHIEDKLNYAN